MLTVRSILSFVVLVSALVPSVVRAEACDRAELDRAYGYVRDAPVPKLMRMAYGKASTLKGDTQGPGQTRSFQLEPGDTLRLHETAQDCVGVALRDPSGKLALRMYDQRTVFFTAAESGLHQLVLVGYAGASGRNAFALQLIRGKVEMGPEEREALSLMRGKHTWDLDNSPLALKALKRKLGAKWTDFRTGLATMTAFEVIEGYLVGGGCDAHECGSAGSFLAVDLGTGRTTAARMRSTGGQARVRVIVGDADGLPSKVKRAYAEWQ